MEEEYSKTQEYQEVTAEQEQLFKQLFEIEDKEQRNRAIIEFDSLKGGELTAAKKFYYQAGINDAMRIFNIS